MWWPVMDDHQAMFRISACTSGRAALRIAHGAREGRIAAVMRSTFYVETDNDVFCIGHEAVHLSPLNLVTTAPSTTDWQASGLRAGDRALLSNDMIRLGNRLSIDTSDTKAWSPEPVPDGWSKREMSRGLSILRREAPNRLPDGGLGRFICQHDLPGDDDPLCVRAAAPIQEASDWLVDTFDSTDQSKRPSWVADLVGLGPGLTPSGDDFLAGMMIALHAVGQRRMSGHIWVQAWHCGDAASNPISRAHLNAASAGEGNETLHRALVAVMAGQPDAIRRSLTDIAGVGHTSGWDAMAGVALVFDAWLRRPED
ncbi:MAG: DUF2877 domain-containing protein [Pseudomonadota bacterium]